MLPVVAGEKETKNQILIYSLILAPLGVAPYMVGMSSVYYAVLSAALGGVFVYKAWQLHRAHDLSHAMPLFTYSLYYLSLIFLGLIVDRFIIGML